ncbi:MAG: dihydroxyacetone kinase subunit DhaK [Moraxellaceae bacterium]|nr:dihydroxyacetone kinase subunit DhaK [Moraxellaceae bacterium]
MKKLINQVEDVVVESLRGMQVAHADLIQVHYEPNFITRAKKASNKKVALVSGGGSGHEPLHGGFVGYGMLDAACPGAVFTSPTPDQMEMASKAVDNGAGVLHIVKNYSGDVMNFEMAAELCMAEGIEVESVVIDDDVAVQDSLYTEGRRGVGATVFAEKIVGAGAETGMPLKQVADLCREVNANSRSMGMALTSCTVPAAGKPTFDIDDTSVEMGVGIHGEPGRERMPHKTAKEYAEMMSEAIIKDLPFKQGDNTIVMLNGMGGTPLMELYLLYNELDVILKKHGIKVARQLVGNYITSLEMQGFSISMLKASDEHIKLWDVPVHTAGLRWGM